MLPLPVALHGPLGYCTVAPEEGKLFQAAGLGITTRLTPEPLGAAPVELPDGAFDLALQSSARCASWTYAIHTHHVHLYTF